MEFRVLEKNKDKTRISIMVKNIPNAYLNTIRRIMIEEVPVMAIEDVEFIKNNSLLYDEMVALRLGLLSLSTDLKSYNLPAKCSCKGEGCAKCQLKLTMKAKGPEPALASEIKSKDPKVKPIFPETPIVKLLADQEIELIATAVLGQGKEHAKWSPGLFYYRNKPTITIKKKTDKADLYVEACSVGVFENKKGELELNKDNILKCHLCGACTDIPNSVVGIEESPDEYLLFMESWGQLDCKEIGSAGIDIFEEQLDEFIENVSKI